MPHTIYQMIHFDWLADGYLSMCLGEFIVITKKQLHVYVYM